MKKKPIWNVLITWFLVALAFWLIFITTQESEIKYKIYYFIVWILVIGSLIWCFRQLIKNRVSTWRTSPLFKFIFLAYGMVLFEELIAAFSLHLSEGFYLPLYLERVGQFWLLNILAFTGIIFATYFLYTRLRYSQTEMFMLIGIWGLYAEHTYVAIFGNPIAFLALLPFIVITYGLIFTPALWSIGRPGTRHMNPVIKYFLTFLVFFVFSILPALAINHIRTNAQNLFAPAELID